MVGRSHIESKRIHLLNWSKMNDADYAKHHLQEIDSLHAEWERIDKTAKLGWLTGEKMRLNRLADRFAQYISVRGGLANDEERAYASRLLEMINAVDSEGAKMANDLANETLKEWLC